MNSLPIDHILEKLKDAVREHPSVVLQAPPGAGKTTRVPLALLDLIPAGKGRIVMLEPRRIAAVSAARWMAKTLGEEAGRTVGYTIRFESRVSKSTRIEVVTEGILTRRMQADPALEGVAMVIFDEFHERSLHADLALALCLDLRGSLREDLKVLVMSATLDCGPVASLLGNAPVITSGGRAFPVEERYLEGKDESNLQKRVTEAVALARRETMGDILVFLPGSGEIRACAESLRSAVKGKGQDIEVHPLYGDLPFEEQERAILPGSHRKIVLATNIAETSLTIEGVRVVIDSGFTRKVRHDPSTGMNRLVTIAVSRASAEQRKGRAGRLGEGVCYRLYSRHAFQSMLPYTSPEILVSDLSSLALELAVWGAKDPSELRWLDAPPEAAWNSALRLLVELGALDESGPVTLQGKAMAELPLHPRLACIMIRARDLGCPLLGADLAALLSERDILRRRFSAGRMVHDSEPDIAVRLDILRVWRKGRQLPDAADPLAIRSVIRTSDRLLGRGFCATSKAGKCDGTNTDEAEMISRLLLCAFPDRIAGLREEGGGRFLLSQGRGVRMSTSSPLSTSLFIIAANMDAGEKAEGFVHLAAPLTVEIIRRECGRLIETIRRVQWSRREERVVATIEERVGSVVLLSKPFNPTDEEAGPLLCEAIRLAPNMLNMGDEVRQFQGRVTLMRKIFPDETWPELSDERLSSNPEEWLLPWLGRRRSSQEIKNLDILPALKTRLSREEARILDERTPAAVVVPSGRRVAIDYASGGVPVLAVKLQEMFGLADTPQIAGGRVKLLLHLLSPARRPVQITQDLKGFWNNGYKQVKKELKGRYPKHPWPDDPWNAVPTGRTKPRPR